MKRTALITGASSGIGEATAKSFANHDINLIICGRNENKLKELARELESSVDVKLLVFDIGEFEAVKRAIEGLDPKWQKIDILVNNAGGAHGLELLEDALVEDWEKMIDSNLKGLLYISKLIIPKMIHHGRGHIINVGSIAGKQTYAKGVVYCAVKSGVEAISKGMRLELVPKGIKVTNIAPGAVDTNFSNVRFKGDLERAKAVYHGYTPLYADDIASCIQFCVSAPDHVQVADMTIFPSAQSDATTIHRRP